ncbi:MAG: ABC transporter substrate-binding protein [Actinomycetota bacterium]
MRTCLIARAGVVTLVLVVAVLAAGCGSDGEAEADPAPPDASAPTVNDEDPTDATSTTSSAAAPSTTTTELPADLADDGRQIIALDEQAALTLLSLDVWPDNVMVTLASETFAQLNDGLGIPTTEFVIAEPSFEVLAALSPDLLVSIGSPFVVDSIEAYEAVAPIVVAPLDATWQQQLTSVAAGLGAEDRAAALIEAVDAHADATAAALDAAGTGDTSVSVVTARVGAILAVNASGATGELLTQIGLDRPAAQRATGNPGIPFVPVSPETILDHDADLLLLPRAAIFDLDPFTSAPLYAELGAVADGGVHDVVADAWVLGGTGFASFWALEDMRSLLVEGAAPAGLADTADRWSAFLELIG